MDFPREYYVGYPDDENDEFEEKMYEIAGADDVNKLHEYLKVFGNKYHYPAFLDMCLFVRARECALHIIRGKLPHGPPSLAADHCHLKPRVPVLYRVIHVMCEPQVLHLLLTDCKAVNQVNQPFEGLVPLQWLLLHLSKQPPLSDWSPTKPLSTLIQSLYLPQLRPKLECARMLAQHTSSLDQVASGFIQNQEIIQLAALLLVAPFSLGDFETIKPYTRIVSQAIHGQSVTPATYCAAALLYIFENDGHKMTSRFNNPQEGSAQAAEGDQSFVNSLIQKPRERLVQVSKGGSELFNSRDAGHVNLTLLHFALGSLVKYDYLSKWSPGQSLVKLILLLFLQRELRPTLECVQLIAERTNSVNEVAWNLIQQGELIQLAGLLLVARKKAMEPLDSGDTIIEATSMENNVSRVFHGEPVTAATLGAAGLFEIFDKAGDALAKYWSIHNDEHKPEPVGVIVEVATRIQHSGIQVLPTDVDLTDIYSTSSHPERLKSICERLGIKVDDTSGLSHISSKSRFPSVQSVKERCQPSIPTCSSQRYARVPGEYKPQGIDNLGSRAYSTSFGIVERVRGGTMKHSWAWTSPIARDLAYLAMKFKRGGRLI